MDCRTVLMILLVSASAFPAFSQNTAELDRRGGFKSIKLASPIDSVKDAVLKKEFLEKDEFPARLYETTNSEYMSIGEVSVREIKMMTYKNLIYKIIVTTEKDPRIMQALEKSFGKSVYVVRTSTFNWKTEKLSLTFTAHRNSIELVYRSYPVFKMMNDDKGKKVELIAEDF